MSLRCGFYNSENGDREYFNEDLSNFLEGLITDGIYEYLGDQMMVKASATPNMAVNIGTGRAWFNATWTKIDALYPVGITASDPVLSRIDAICLTVNNTRAVRDNYIEVIEGTGAATSPQKPIVENETNIYRHVLAYVSIPAGATVITQAQIENRVGMGSALFSKPKWENIPTTEQMVAQWQTQFDQFMDHIHETFDYDAAGNLQVGVDNLAPDLQTGGPFSNGDYALDQNVFKKKVEGIWTPTKVSIEIKDMKAAFQAGVDAVYNACIQAGLTPSSSTPEDIAAAIATVGGATALAGDILIGKKAFSQNQMLNGAMPNNGAWVSTGTPSGNNEVDIVIPAGYHNGSGKVTCKGQTAYSSGRTQGRADKLATSMRLRLRLSGATDYTSAEATLYNAAGTVIDDVSSDYNGDYSTYPNIYCSYSNGVQKR